MISCNEYDYIEIVCMYQYAIKLTMKIGHVIECVALDTKYNEEREECIKVNVQSSETLIPLSDIQKLEVCVENPHFKEISFT